MNANTVPILLAAISISSIGAAQTPKVTHQTSANNAAKPADGAPKAYIAKFVATPVGDGFSWMGPLHIIYSDGIDIALQNEHGGYAVNNDVRPQVTFGRIKISDDRQSIGWFASYMMCEQSYPCDLELPIFRARHIVRTFVPLHGVFWDWNFRKGGKVVATESGFPHGADDHEYALYDISSGRRLAHYGSKGSAPKWVDEAFPDRDK
jgi:hypothetical protein